MKRYTLFIALCCLLAACKKESADFSYSPAQPRAGETVVFSNSSTTGEEWSWNFGDGNTSTSKSPIKIYRQPGTYAVTLMVDKKKALTRVKEITIYDTVPNFSSSIDSTGLGIYVDATFKALVYNPYSQVLTYKWSIEGDDLQAVVNGPDTTATFSVYFRRSGTARVVLDVDLNGVKTHVVHSYTVKDRPSEGVLMQNAEGAYRQRVYSSRVAEAVSTTAAADLALLEKVQDTLQVYNDSTFVLKNLTMGGHAWDGFRIINQRVYLRSEEYGLYVYRIDGTYGVQIEDEPTYALMIDPIDNRIYWAVKDSVMYMPLVNQNFNEFTTIPERLNSLTGVTRLAKDNEKK